MLEPLLGQRAPAIKDLLAARHVRSLCHEKVRKEENGRQRNGTNHSDGTQIFCGKHLPCPAVALKATRLSTGSTAAVALSSQSTVKRPGCMPAPRVGLAFARTTSQRVVPAKGPITGR